MGVGVGGRPQAMEGVPPGYLEAEATRIRTDRDDVMVSNDTAEEMKMEVIVRE